LSLRYFAGSFIRRGESFHGSDDVVYVVRFASFKRLVATRCHSLPLVCPYSPWQPRVQRERTNERASERTNEVKKRVGERATSSHAREKRLTLVTSNCRRVATLHRKVRHADPSPQKSPARHHAHRPPPGQPNNHTQQHPTTPNNTQGRAAAAAAAAATRDVIRGRGCGSAASKPLPKPTPPHHTLCPSLLTATCAFR